MSKESLVRFLKEVRPRVLEDRAKMEDRSHCMTLVLCTSKSDLRKFRSCAEQDDVLKKLYGPDGRTGCRFEEIMSDDEDAVQLARRLGSSGGALVTTCVKNLKNLL